MPDRGYLTEATPYNRLRASFGRIRTKVTSRETWLVAEPRSVYSRAAVDGTGRTAARPGPLVAVA
jgi:hypothetical protein